MVLAEKCYDERQPDRWQCSEKIGSSSIATIRLVTLIMQQNIHQFDTGSLMNAEIEPSPKTLHRRTSTDGVQLDRKTNKIIQVCKYCELRTFRKTTPRAREKRFHGIEVPDVSWVPGFFCFLPVTILLFQTKRVSKTKVNFSS